MAELLRVGPVQPVSVTLFDSERRPIPRTHHGFTLGDAQGVIGTLAFVDESSATQARMVIAQAVGNGGWTPARQS
jgi:hypothetical protein